jgi:hypothetical protein
MAQRGRRTSGHKICRRFGQQCTGSTGVPATAWGGVRGWWRMTHTGEQAVRAEEPEAWGSKRMSPVAWKRCMKVWVVRDVWESLSGSWCIQKHLKPIRVEQMEHWGFAMVSQMRLGHAWVVRWVSDRVASWVTHWVTRRVRPSNLLGDIRVEAPGAAGLTWVVRHV